MVLDRKRKIKCPVCGKIFTTTSRTQKYCCQECKMKSDLKDRRAKKSYIKQLRKEKQSMLTKKK